MDKRNIKMCEKCVYYCYFLEKGVDYLKERYTCGMDDWFEKYKGKSGIRDKATFEIFVNLKPPKQCPYTLEHIVMENKVCYE